MDPDHSFLTHTWSECVENHAGMQTIGNKLSHGFSDEDLESFHARHGGTLHRLEPPAGWGGVGGLVLVLPGAVDKFCGPGAADALHAESMAQPFDERYYDAKKKKVFTKHGRMNNCYADAAQAPDIDNGKGTVIAFKSAPQMAKLRAKLPTILNESAKNLYAETNLYTDVRKLKVGIGFHGDTERSLVVGVRLGKASLPLRFHWFHRCQPVGREHSIPLHHGDMYIMSHKATGWDWRCSSRYTLRHGVGRKAVIKAKKPTAPKAAGKPKKATAPKRGAIRK